MVLVGISFWGCSVALAASTACKVTERWFTPHISVLASFSIGRWSAEVSCPIVSQPLWPACWIDTPDGSSSSVSRAVQDAWCICRDALGLVPPDVVLALVVPPDVALAIRDAVAGSCGQAL